MSSPTLGAFDGGRRRAGRAGRALCALAVGVAAVSVAALLPDPAAAPPFDHLPAASSVAAVPAAPRQAMPAVAPWASAEGVPAALAADLARIAAAAAADGRAGDTTAAAGPPLGLGLGLWPAASTGPRLALARHDALEAAAARPTVALPLFTEEIVVLVRAEAPWLYLHELRGLRLNLGPAEGARAATVGALYRRLFDEPVPTAPGTTFTTAAALPALLDGRLDAIALVLPQSPDAIAAALGGLPPGSSAALRRLSLAPAHPASRRALRAYLPALSLHDATGRADPVPTLAVMSYLVIDDADPAVATHAVDALCERLPALQRHGHPKWREVQPGLVLPNGAGVEAAAASAWQRCAAGASAALHRPPAGPGAAMPASTPPAVPVFSGALP